MSNWNDAEVVHGCPIDGESLTTCCLRTPFELPRKSRMTAQNYMVTCDGGPKPVEAKEAAPRSDLRWRITMGLEGAGEVITDDPLKAEDCRKRGFVVEEIAALEASATPAQSAIPDDAALAALRRVHDYGLAFGEPLPEWVRITVADAADRLAKLSSENVRLRGIEERAKEQRTAYVNAAKLYPEKEAMYAEVIAVCQYIIEGSQTARKVD